jgi:type II secretory pathway component GspD/PulD (secretin)
VEPAFQRVISIDVRRQPIEQVIEEIRRKTGAKILVDPRLDLKITITLRDLPWRDIIHVLAKLYKLEIQEKDGAYSVAGKPKTNIQFVDADLPTALLLLAQKSGKNVIIAPEVTGKINLHLKDVSYHDALKVIARNAGHKLSSESNKTVSIKNRR